MLREGARCEVLPDILGRANIDVTQNIFARAGGTNEWMRDMVGGRKTLTVEISRLLQYRLCPVLFSTFFRFFSTLLQPLRDERHFALVEIIVLAKTLTVLMPYQPRLARNQFRSESRSDPCISSVTTSIMITTSNSSLKRSGLPNQLLDVLLHTIAISGLSRVRTELS